MPRDDGSNFAPSIVKLAGDDELRRRLARDAQRYAREWQSGAIVGNLVGLL